MLILAAGASTRMGQPKQLLPWGNSNLLNHTINTGLALNNTDVFVALGANHEKITPQLKKGTQTLYCKDWQQGMGHTIAHSVSTIISKTNYNRLLITLTDLPLISTINYQKMIELSEVNNLVVAAQYQDRVGVPAVFTPQYFSQLSHLETTKGAQSILQQISTIKSFDLHNQLEDLDTYANYLKLYNKHH